MFCPKCGKEIDDQAVICLGCGCRVTPVAQQKPAAVPAEVDGPSTAYFWLSFFIPLVGLILFLVYESSLPQKAKSAGKGALIGFLVGIVLSVLIVILYITLVVIMVGSLT